MSNGGGEAHSFQSRCARCEGISFSEQQTNAGGIKRTQSQLQACRPHQYLRRGSLGLRQRA